MPSCSRWTSAIGSFSFAFTTFHAPSSRAFWRRMSNRSTTVILLRPMARSAKRVTRPMQPPPRMAADWPILAPDSRAAVMPTASGSISAPSSDVMPSGSLKHRSAGWLTYSRSIPNSRGADLKTMFEQRL